MRRKPSVILRAMSACAVAAMLGAAGCATGWESSRAAPGFTQVGVASWYGQDFHGRPTASGEPYDMWAHTAAHRTLPFDTRVRVTHLATDAATEVRINDRGPFVRNRIIDLSLAAARDLGLDRSGTGRVRLQVISSSGVYLLQLGSFEERANAETLRHRLRAAGYRAELEPAGSVIRVVIRDLDAASAEHIASELAMLGFPRAVRRLQAAD